ncbi:cyclophane-forming radical SAM/SPASM peptide maturase GrrM/OscB [Synechococcus sp. CCY 9618]|uniref:cyclophane-forming radical SAM/SPASM peptide maturase GrrM/OscB n=1 Tax=Synechococcus sp. CCY 9618 TaxID=2815602 RepID=UPI001C21846A
MPPPPIRCGPLSLLVVQPTPFCNLDCDYCYLPERDNRGQLDPALLEPILERVLASPFLGDSLTLLWHAGEPLAVPIAFYDEASARLRSALARHDGPTVELRQAIQTNGTLIDAAWCDCFERNGIDVGVSLDGPAFLHDAHRRTRTGLGSHAATMRGIGWLQRRALPFHVISVITENALDHADTIFEFFLAHDIKEVGFNMEETEGENRVSSLERPGTEARWRAFLQRFWELTGRHPGALRLREFEQVCALACGDARLERTDMNKPFVILNVDYRGHFSTFDPELLAVKTQEYGDFVLGNVRTDSLESVLATEKFQRMHRDMAAGVEACRSSCDYFGLCGGGAGSNKYWELGTFDGTETQACRYRIKAVADVVLAGMERELAIGADV